MTDYGELQHPAQHRIDLSRSTLSIAHPNPRSSHTRRRPSIESHDRKTYQTVERQCRATHAETFASGTVHDFRCPGAGTEPLSCRVDGW